MALIMCRSGRVAELPGEFGTETLVFRKIDNFSLNFDPLEFRRLIFDMVMVYKIPYGL